MCSCSGHDETPIRQRRNRQASSRQRCCCGCQRFVSVSSLLLALVIFALACLHLNYLFESFVRKKVIQGLLSEGKKLDPYQALLWCLLYSFGETPWSPHPTQALLPDTHEYDLRIWKLSGLVSAYTLAIAINLGLFVGAACSSISALFIPWIVVNFVAVLGFFSLFLGIVIVHLAYSSVGGNGEQVQVQEEVQGVGHGILVSLVPLAVAFVLFAYWLVVVRVYLAKVRRGSEEEEEEEVGLTRGAFRSASDEQRVSLLMEEDDTSKPEKIGESRSIHFSGLLCNCLKKKKRRKSTSNGGASGGGGGDWDDCHHKMLESLSVHDGLDGVEFAGEKNNMEGSSSSQPKVITDEGEKAPWVSRSPFLPELRHDRKRRQGGKLSGE